MFIRLREGRWWKVALLVGVLAVALAPVAAAHPVAPHKAAGAVRADHWDFGPQPPVVDHCAAYHYGTLCRVQVGVCYADRAFGDSVFVDTSRAWVSRTRHGPVSVVILRDSHFDIWPDPTGCVVGAEMYPPWDHAKM